MPSSQMIITQLTTTCAIVFLVKGKAVIELGCGLGVPSCAAAFAGAVEVGKGVWSQFICITNAYIMT